MASHMKTAGHRYFLVESGFLARDALAFSTSSKTDFDIFLPVKFGNNPNRPLTNSFGAFVMSLKKSSVPVLYLPISSISKTRPYRLIRRRKVRLKKATLRSGLRMPSSRARFRSASMMAARSTSRGHRVVQVSHDAHSQIVLDRSASSTSPI